MGFLSSALKSVYNPVGYWKDLSSSFSGASQQADANAKAMESWNLMNDYNHPVQQMERLKLAGLNPNLVYGSGAVTGNTTSAPALQGGGVLTGPESVVRGLGQVLGLAQGTANLQNTRAQTQASVASAGASQAQASNLNAQTAINEAKAGMEEKLLIADLDYKKAQTELTRQQTAKTKAEADITQGEADIFGSVGGSKGAGTIGKGLSKVGRFVKGMVK